MWHISESTRHVACAGYGLVTLDQVKSFLGNSSYMARDHNMHLAYCSILLRRVGGEL